MQENASAGALLKVVADGALRQQSNQVGFARIPEDPGRPPHRIETEKRHLNVPVTDVLHGGNHPLCWKGCPLIVSCDLAHTSILLEEFTNDESEAVQVANMG